MTTKDVTCQVGCSKCGNPIRIDSRDLEANVKQHGVFVCGTCHYDLEEVHS